jgi:hypothetical protein
MSTATIVYRTADGRQFDSEQEAADHEAFVAKIPLATASLGPRPEAVEDGKGWVQHSEAAYRAAHRATIQLARPLFKGFKNLENASDDEIHPLGYAGRVVDDSGSPLWSTAWFRLSCIDSQFREHQQPYFAIHGPDKGQVCVEDRR